MFARLFLDHPRSIGETYFQHQRRGLWFAGRLITAGLACAVHGIAPWLFERTVSTTIRDLHAEMSQRAAAS